LNTQLIDLDALMVHEVLGNPDSFDRDPGGAPGDEILFSIKQIPNPLGGYYATGSEIFFMNASGPDGFLSHGGHLWDKAYALANLITIAGTNLVQHDINAIEAVADVPEPASLLLVLLGVAAAANRSRRK
jgi:hypothetical protein